MTQWLGFTISVIESSSMNHRVQPHQFELRFQWKQTILLLIAPWPKRFYCNIWCGMPGADDHRLRNQGCDAEITNRQPPKEAYEFAFYSRASISLCTGRFVCWLPSTEERMNLLGHVYQDIPLSRLQLPGILLSPWFLWNIELFYNNAITTQTFSSPFPYFSLSSPIPLFSQQPIIHHSTHFKHFPAFW